jgi:serine/threonine protein kinase/Flp pilus assembly protein TadD
MSTSGSGADPLGQLADEFLQRQRRGERPTLTEYTARHPELAQQIRELFPALLLLEDVRPDPQAAAETVPVPGDSCLLRLGEYRIVREIGRGGMGVVYEAEQVSLHRRVALKVLPPGALQDARHIERFQREARAAARLHHTNIVPVFAVGEEDGTHYYVMQYIEGRSLDEVLAELRKLRTRADTEGAPSTESVLPEGAAAQAEAPSCEQVARSLAHGSFRPARRPEDAVGSGPDPAGGPPPSVASRPPGSGVPPLSSPLTNPQCSLARSVAHIGVQVAEALEYAAGQGVLHRDIKPSNLLLDVWGNVWLTDFGLAKATGAPDLTRTGDLVGTLRYLAPERLQGRADVRSDVYALGLTLYEMLALRPAFDGHDHAQLAQQLTTAAPPRLDRLDSRLPRDLVTIIHKAMAREPADRYQTAGALAEDLRRFLDDRSIVARRASLPEQAWRWCRRNPSTAALVGALLALLLVATGSGVWLVRQHAERQAEAARRGREQHKEVGTALAQAVSFRKGLHFREARELLEQAGELVGPAGPEDLRRQVDQARADLVLAERLDAARLKAGTLVEGKFDLTRAEPLYAAALAEAGLGREGDNVAEVAARMRDSAVRAEIVAGLDDWASITKDRARRAWLLAVAREVDPHPTRDRLRQPELWQDGIRLTQTAQELQVDELSPQLASALARVMVGKGSAAVPLLTAAQARNPQDFWLNYQLGYVFFHAQQWDEALGYYRVAMALRPEESKVYNGVGASLHNKGRLDEAIDCYRQTIRLNPKDPDAHYNLASALQGKGRLEEAIDHHREAIRLDPCFAEAHHNLAACLYDDACAAVRTATGKGPEKAPPGEAERAALRRQALDRLRENLELRNKVIKEGMGVGWSFTAWQKDPELAGVRERAALAKLPEAEREQWDRLWKDVAASDATDPVEQGRAHAMHRDWARAAECYAPSLKVDWPDNGFVWFETAAVLLLSGDRAGYTRARDLMVDQCGKAPKLRPYLVARACTLAPDVPVEVSLPGSLVERELKASPKQFWSLTEQGALYYRAGRFKEAVPLFEQSLKADRLPGRAVLNWLWLALANQRLGKTEEARDWLGKAQRWLDQYPDGMPDRPEAETGAHLHNWLEAHVLRREAEDLLKTGPVQPK